MHEKIWFGKKSMSQKIKSFFGYLSALLGSLTILLSFIGWLTYPHLESFVMNIVNKNKGESTRSDLAKEMGVKKKDVCEEIGQMYIENKHRHDLDDKIFNKWIPYLEDETKWSSVGYFVSTDDKTITKFHHWDGRTYNAWNDDNGWFYIKGGLKFYD